jgi:2-oxo-4-hydroxy-4-carboxy-5-ureidoimidazoline decarboxylase
MAELTLDTLNQADDERFVAELGGIYEHSPWVAQRVTAERPFDSAEDVQAAMQTAVDEASRERKLELLRAHPDLGDQTGITDASKEEQASAGLDDLSEELYESFQQLNDRYREKFGFPFIMAVKDESPTAIKQAMERRVDHTEAEEFQTALEQVHQIAQFRLDDLFGS